jgi:predicted permease
MAQDFIVAARTLVHRPGYAVSVVLTLALGIGASTMMFSLLDAAVLRPLPFKEPDRLVTLLGVAGPERDVRGASFPEFRDWRSLNVTLEDVAIYDETSLNLRLGNEAVRVDAEMVSPAYFTLLGVEAASGRTFTLDEDRTPDAHPVVIISNRLWRDRFGRRADILAQPVFLNDRQLSIVGVMPEGFSGLSFDTDVWFPSMMISLTSSPAVVDDRGSRWLTAIGRLKSGVTIERASDDMARVAAILEKEYPDTNRQRGVLVLGTHEAILGRSTDDLLAALFGAVLLFLVMACANVASLQLARTIARRRELAVRMALGASRWHVFRSLLAETLILSAIAGTFGALLAAWGLSAAVAIMPVGALPQFVSPSVDVRALLFAAVAAGAAGALVAVLPALSGTGRDVAHAIKEGTRSAAGGLGNLRKRSPQQMLVIGEIALAMTLLTGAALLVRSLDRQLSVRLGFEPSGVTIARVSLPGNRYEPPQRRVFVERLNEHLKTLPNVAAAAIASDLPLTGVASASSLLTEASDARMRYYRHFVTPGFFRMLGIEITHGRDFTTQDTSEAPPVAIINEAGARRLWGGANEALGRRVRLGSTGATAEIVGIVPNARFRDLTTDITAGGAEPDVFFPYAQRTDRDIAIAVRAATGAAVTVGALQQAVAELDAGLPVYAVRTLEDAVAQQTATSRFGSALLTIFSAGALLLAAIGLYGLISYVIGLSRREIAVRMALGADVRRIVLLVVRNGLALVGIGVALGVIGALIAGRALRTQLFETEPMDPAVYAAVAALLVAVAAIATLVPARGAARVNPQTALRAE